MKRVHCLIACEIPVPTMEGRTLSSGHPHVPSFHIMPARLAEQYSGCAYAWVKDDKTMLLYQVARFESGEIVASRSFVGEELPGLQCTFPFMIKDDEQDCRSPVAFWRSYQELQDKPLPK